MPMRYVWSGLPQAEVAHLGGASQRAKVGAAGAELALGATESERRLLTVITACDRIARRWLVMNWSKGLIGAEKKARKCRYGWPGVMVGT